MHIGNFTDWSATNRCFFIDAFPKKKIGQNFMKHKKNE